MSARAVVVLGSSIDRCRRLLVEEAERVARRVDPSLLVFSGWSADGGPSEAARMQRLWRGPVVDTVLEETAQTTAENATRTLPLLRARGIEEAIVVCAPIHLPRARWIFRRVYAGCGVSLRFRAARVT